MLFIGSAVTKAQKASLVQQNIPYFVLPDDKRLSPPLASHPDMQAITVRGKTFASGNAARLLGCTDTNEPLCDGYPQDVLFNGFTLGDKLFCNPKTFSPTVQDYALQCGMDIVEVRQGYAKCTTLVLTKQIITADRGIARAAEPFCNVLLISEGGILLPPYPYGFIGGASFVLGDKVFFFGSLDAHADAANIRTCIEQNGYTAVSLSDEPLTDCGGAIWIE